jgi:hypothetical protein
MRNKNEVHFKIQKAEELKCSVQKLLLSYLLFIKQSFYHLVCIDMKHNLLLEGMKSIRGI